eukprot:4831175-Pleurochrysis_carterae.AAC.1
MTVTNNAQSHNVCGKKGAPQCRTAAAGVTAATLTAGTRVTAAAKQTAPAKKDERKVMHEQRCRSNRR